MSDKKIREGLENMSNLYASKGYLELTPVPQILADDASRTLSITVDIHEGSQYSVNGLTLEGEREWPADGAAKLRALSESFSGSHDVGVFIDQLKKLLAEMFPNYTQIDSLVGVTAGTEQHRATLNVRFPTGNPY